MCGYSEFTLQFTDKDFEVKIYLGRYGGGISVQENTKLDNNTSIKTRDINFSDEDGEVAEKKFKTYFTNTFNVDELAELLIEMVKNGHE